MNITNDWSSENSIPKDLVKARELIYNKLNAAFTEPQPESESAEYSAFRFQLNNKNICYREAKITPTKTGQFVTLWKRSSSKTIAPFDVSDNIDFVLVSVRKNEVFGHFIFPQSVLFEKGIFSTPKKEGIRATRVYPPWDETTSKQAQKTQKWQLDYFIEINESASLEKLKNLLRLL